jgi:predicted membrane-bound mannosyltransferase
MADVTLAAKRALTFGWAARALEATVAGVALVFALRLRLLSLDAYTGSFDEGIRSEQLLLMSAGYRPFRDIFASQGPLLLDLLYPFFAAFGQTLAAARLGVVICSIVALGGAWWTARLAAGPVGGLAAVIILGVSRVFLEGSRLALAEVPTIAPSLIAIGALVAYRRAADRRLLVISVVCCALALLIKPMALHVVVPLGLLLVLPTTDTRDRRQEIGEFRISRLYRFWDTGVRGVVVDVTLYSAVVAALCGLVIVGLGPAQVWDNLGAYRTGAGHQFGADRLANLRLTLNVMAQDQPGLYILAAAGLLVGLWKRPAITVALVGWALAIVALFASYGDLADKHIVYLVPPIALLAALGVGIVADTLVGSIRSKRLLSRGHAVAAVIGGLGLLAYAVYLPAVYRADVYLIREAPKIAAERRGRAVDLEIAEIIRARTPPGGWVLADNPNAAFEARRLVIPYLVDTSGTRIDAGSLTTRLALDQIDQYRPHVIVTWPRRLAKLDELIESLPGRGYHLERSYPLGWKVYVRE